MPVEGEVRKASEIGRTGTGKVIWHSCIICGRQRWVNLRKGYPQNVRCLPCCNAVKVGKHPIFKCSLKRTSVCKTCKVEFPATVEHFKRNKRTKNGLCLSRCKHCLNKKRHRQRTATINGKLHHRISGYIRQALNGTKGYCSWEVLVGYTTEDLIKHLEHQFQSGMTWENYGKWHIDHRIPVVAFNFNTQEDIDFKRCWALSNLQPLWAQENSHKGASIDKPFQPALSVG